MSRMKNRDSNRQRRDDRKIQAKIRQEAYDRLSVEEKILKLDVGGFAAKKQRARLQKQAAK